MPGNPASLLRTPTTPLHDSPILVKHIWEEERGGEDEAPYIHNVHGLFHELNPQTQRDVEALYHTCCREYEAAVRAGKRQHGPQAFMVDMANLDEALRWNQNAVRNLKYEMTPRGRSVPTGLFWDSGHVWVVPSTFPNFAIELVRWAAGRSFKGPPP